MNICCCLWRLCWFGWCFEFCCALVVRVLGCLFPPAGCLGCELVVYCCALAVCRMLNLWLAVAWDLLFGDCVYWFSVACGFVWR